MTHIICKFELGNGGSKRASSINGLLSFEAQSRSPLKKLLLASGVSEAHGPTPTSYCQWKVPLLDQSFNVYVFCQQTGFQNPNWGLSLLSSAVTSDDSNS